MRKTKTKAKDKTPPNLADNFNSAIAAENNTAVTAITSEIEETKYKDQISDAVSKIFDTWDEKEFVPKDFQIEVRTDSLESSVGYTSLIRQMHGEFVRDVAFYRSSAGGSLSVEDARAAAFRPCTNKEEAKRLFDDLMAQPLESLNFVDLMKLYSFAPRVAEMFWEGMKGEGRAEFESGHLAAQSQFPVGYMKGLWNIARYLGVRESFIADWQPKGGIEVAMIDMLAQAYFQWRYWLEQTVLRSQTRAREKYEYDELKQSKANSQAANNSNDGYWDSPCVSEQAAIEHSVQMADRWNRIFMRTLRQLRDLRRYSPVTINNPSQVNIAADGGQQVNVQKN